MHIKTGSLNKLISIIADIADLNDSGSLRHGHKSYSNKQKKKKN